MQKISEQGYTKIQKTAKYSMCAVITKQLKALDITPSETVFAFVEEVDGVKRIVIEKVEA